VFFVFKDLLHHLSVFQAHHKETGTGNFCTIFYTKVLSSEQQE